MANMFPSPYWGLFFYRIVSGIRYYSMIVLCFRPRTGDYFFIDISVPQRTVLPAGKFPSPYWGLFFYLKQYC